MSKHHHHPHEGHSSGTSPAAKTRSHGVFFYVAGVFILIALLCFIVNGATFFRSPAVPAPAVATPGR
jgi:hypothetical protein